jgi:hypothetical protein
MYGVIPGVDVTAGPLARGQYIYGRASQTEQRSARDFWFLGKKIFFTFCEIFV